MSDAPISFSENEMKLMAYAWLCLEGDVKINYEKLAPMSGYTLGSAKVTFGKIRRKIKAFDGSADGTAAVAPATPKKAASAAPKTPKSSAKRGAATNTGEDGSPTKKSKATPKGRGKKKVVKAEEDAMDNEDDVGLKRKVERYVKEEVVDEDEELEDENGGSQSLFGDGAV